MAIFAISMPLRCRWSRCEPVVGGPEQETPAIPAYRAAPRLRSTSRRCRWVSRSIPASMKRRLLALSLSGKPLLSRLFGRRVDALILDRAAVLAGDLPRDDLADER